MTSSALALLTVGDAVASTARWIAANRALESKRPDSLFIDRFADALAGQEGYAFNGGSSEPMPIAVSRTRFIDDWLLRACADGAVRQVVDLGAGMDTRAYRLPLPPGTVFFEVDKPEIFALKEPILKPMVRPEERARVDRRIVQVDFDAAGSGAVHTDWERALLDAGFDAHSPAIWILEGLVYYLPERAVLSLFHKASTLAQPGSALFMDLVSSRTLRDMQGSWLLDDLKRRGCPWLWAHDNPPALLQQYGWAAEATSVADLGIDRARRTLAYPRRRRVGDTMFVTALKAGPGAVA